MVKKRRDPPALPDPAGRPLGHVPPSPMRKPPVDQLTRDRNLLKRIDVYGDNLLPREKDYIESFMRWVETKELTPAQRKVAEDIDERRVS